METAVKIKQWGNALGVRLTLNFARAARLQAGTLVSVSVEGYRVIIKPAASGKLTLETIGDVPLLFSPTIK